VRRVLLLGGGHAHAWVLLQWIGAPPGDARVTLVTPQRNQLYSGMLPGLVAGHYALDECVIDLAALAARAGAGVVYDRVTSIDPRRRVVRTERSGELAYDVASLNVGSLPAYGSVPGAPGQALPAKPFEPFVQAWSRLRARGGRLRLAVVGAGAAGVELAMAMAYALERGGQRGEVALYAERAAFSPALGRRVARALARNGVELLPATRVEALEPGPVVLAAGERRPFDAVVWTGGAAPLPWFAPSGLELDAAGFVLVDETLRSVSHPEVFAVGDSATLRGAPHPKSGVYAVRHAPVLARNLRGEAKRYAPQRRSLALLSCGARYAIASWDGLAAEGAWAWRWKDRIDRRWIARFAPPA
jgi:pyridine nucleotide-disulfide oxidoreductase family protein